MLDIFGIQRSIFQQILVVLELYQDFLGQFLVCFRLEFRKYPIFQVTKIRNITAPKANEESQTHTRMLKISLTDGKITVHGVELSKLDGISINTPPGTKVKLINSIPVSNGFLRLETGSLKVLGGRVEALYEKWDTSRKMAKFSRNFARKSAIGDTEGPPAWIPFGKKVGKEDKNFKALPSVQQNSDKNEINNAKENQEFDSQRQDLIKEAAKGGGQKVFGGGTKEIKEGKTEKRGRGRRHENKEDQTGQEREQELPAAAAQSVNKTKLPNKDQETDKNNRKERGKLNFDFLVHHSVYSKGKLTSFHWM